MSQKKLFNAVVIILHEACTVPPLNPFYGYPIFSVLLVRPSSHLTRILLTFLYNPLVLQRLLQTLNLCRSIMRLDSNDFVSLALVFVRTAKVIKHIQNRSRYFALCLGFNWCVLQFLLTVHFTTLSSYGWFSLLLLL